MDLPSSLGFQPSTEALEVDQAHGASTFAGRDEWVNFFHSFVEIFLIGSPTDATNVLFGLFRNLGGVDDLFI